MKIYTFCDVHGDNRLIHRALKKINSENPDIVIFGGDISEFEQNLSSLLKTFSSLPMPFVIIPGNHEDPEELKEMCKKFKNIIYLHNSAYKFRDVLIIGSGGGGFSSKDSVFEKYSKRFEKSFERERKIIFVTHAPFYGTKLDKLPIIGHVGNKSYREFIIKFKPKIAICGHLHENFEISEKFKDTLMINPGPVGRILELE